MFAAALGGTDVTEFCQRIVHQPELNLRSYAEVLVPSDLVSLVEGGDFLVITEGATTHHKGRAYAGEDNGDSDDKFLTIRSYSGLVWWDRFQVMDADGDYSDPSIIEDNEDAVSIMAAALNNWNAVEGGSDLSVGTAAGGGVPLVGFRPVDWPWTLDRLREFLVGTGQLDVVENHGADTVDLYNGDFGTDLSASVALQYGTGAFNCVAAKYTFDFTNTVSRIRYLLGPKRPKFDGDIQHWLADVQKDDPCLPGNDGVTTPPAIPCTPPPGPGGQPGTTIGDLIDGVEGLLGLLRRVEIYDANGDEAALRDLYFRIWQSDALVNVRPRRLLEITPEPGISPSFLCGDLITIGAELGESHAGVQRVYSYRAEQDPEGNVQLTQVRTSADQEA